ncbi:MAG: hypothetical protein AAFU73_18260 [Planctomycetota bacterium]
MPNRTLFMALGALALSPLAPAQESTSGAPATVRFTHPESVLFAEGDGGTRWALGQSYKTAAGPGGLTYAPFRGSDAPFTEAFDWTASSLTVGGQTVEFEPEGATAREGDVLSVDRGALVERLDCGLYAVEFLAEVRVPDGFEGALELAYRKGDAYETHAAEEGGLVLRGELGDVHMGAAFAVLPDASRVPIALEPTDEGFHFLVPSEVVASSEGLVVIDPLITSQVLTVSSATDATVESAAYGDEFRIVIERIFSNNDHDVFLYGASTGPLPYATYLALLDGSYDDWRDPTIAVRASQGDLLVAAEMEWGSLDVIRAVWALADGSFQGAPFNAMNGFDPEVCVDERGPLGGITPRWAIFARGTHPTTQVLVSRIVASAGGVAAPFGPSQSFLMGGELGAIATPGWTGPASGLSFTTFHVAYEKWSGLGGYEIRIATFDANGTLVADASLTSLTGPVTHLSICADGVVGPGHNTRRFGVAYDEAIWGFGTSEVKVIATDGAAALGPPVVLGEITDTERFVYRRHPSIASDGERWTLSYEEGNTATSRWEITVVEGSYAAGRFGLTSRRTVEPVFSGGSRSAPSTASQPFHLGRSSALTAYVGDGDSFALFTDPGSETAAGVQECDAAPNAVSPYGAWLSARGTTDVLSPKTIVLQDAPPGEVASFFVSMAPDFVPAFRGSFGNLCLARTTMTRFGSAGDRIRSTGTLQVEFDPTTTPGVAGSIGVVVGDTRWVQAWYRDPLGGFTGSNFSNAVRLDFDH